MAGLLVVFVISPPQLVSITQTDTSSSHAVGRIVGMASVTDGDTLTIRGTRIRLHGIDAPEARQTCTNTSGGKWNCGQEAGRALAIYIRGSEISCKSLGQDDYGRTLAVCYSGSEDINSWLVREGWAVAYRRYSWSYVYEEYRARAAGRNIWNGSFETPETWRRAQRV